MRSFKLAISITSFLILLFCSCSNHNGLRITNDKEIRMVQRGSMVIKGSEGDVELTLGDVTGGAVDVKLEGIENGKMYFTEALSEGNEGYFLYAKNYYRIKVTHFEEHMLHDDFAFITFREVTGEKAAAGLKKDSIKKANLISPAEIRNYLEKIKSSGLTFIRNGDSISDSVMAAHIEDKYMFNRYDVKTKNDFTKIIISESALTGESYKVIEKNNDTVSLVNWLKL